MSLGAGVLGVPTMNKSCVQKRFAPFISLPHAKVEQPKSPNMSMSAQANKGPYTECSSTHVMWCVQAERGGGMK